MSALRPPDPGAVGAAFDALAAADLADVARRKSADEKEAAYKALQAEFFGVLEKAMLDFMDAADGGVADADYNAAKQNYYRLGHKVAARFHFAGLSPAAKGIVDQVEDIIAVADLRRLKGKDSVG